MVAVEPALRSCLMGGVAPWAAAPVFSACDAVVPALASLLDDAAEVEAAGTGFSILGSALEGYLSSQYLQRLTVALAAETRLGCQRSVRQSRRH